MRKPLAIIGAIVVSFGLGALVAGSSGAAGAGGGDWELDVPAAAAKLWFPPADQFDNEGEPLSDESFEELMAALEVAMTAEETLADFEREADLHLWNFMRRLSVPEIGDEQKERIHAYLDALAEEHPDSEVIGQRKRLVDSYAEHMPSMPGFAGFVTLFEDEEGSYPEEGEPFEDWQVDRMLAELDAVANLPEATGDFETELRIPLWQMGNRLQRSALSDDQTDRIVAFLDELEEKYPEGAEPIEQQRFVVQNLMPGKVAPNIVGKDTEGVEFTLEDYRGNIVAVIFSGQWCGPCRGEYPYQRGMLEAFKDRDVVLLGVNSDAVLDTIVHAKERERLDYRTWWDGHSQPDADLVAAEGPIAKQWNVVGWPTIYVIDEDGVIRHADKRGGALVAAVDKLLMDKTMREYQEQAEQGVEVEADAEVSDEGESEDANAKTKVTGKSKEGNQSG
ncbi:MAG: TlpA family protein disulfide reductase [Gemmatimonadetes bacterium]|nr:peroxiredoxin family protein [Gemmatimonadota bacterium]MYA11292.1 TlpA family protein disulfide reductase [Gemmatimonadota bacterium]MYE71144.1 TlpA family protein disulfide reductase [Gemmatimonadota bacterium]MYJ69121.1 TlpA family protein disulfide reductase [Gemmatimonadota bacterium]